MICFLVAFEVFAQLVVLRDGAYAKTALAMNMPGAFAWVLGLASILSLSALAFLGVLFLRTGSKVALLGCLMPMLAAINSIPLGSDQSPLECWLRFSICCLMLLTSILMLIVYRSARLRGRRPAG